MPPIAPNITRRAFLALCGTATVAAALILNSRVLIGMLLRVSDS